MAAAEQLITANLDIWSSAVKAKSAAGRGKANKLELYGIKKLRELILELAVRGLLVPQDPNDEPASKLLKKIAAEKEKLVKEGKIKKPKALPPITHDEQLFDLPESWEWCRLREVTEIVRGITFPGGEKSKVAEKGRVACLRTSNVQDEIEWEDLLFIREQFVKRENQYVAENDIVMSMANSRELVGKVAIVSNAPEFRTSFGGFLGVIRPIVLDARFVMSLLRVPTNRNLLIGSASQTTNIANISLGKLNPMVFSVPPLEEQHRIVAKVDELMALCDQLEQQQETSIAAYQTLVQTLLDALTTASERDGFTVAWARIADHFDTLFTTEWSIEQLKQTILQLAVMGKLVPQDPSDEPASVLLKKIAAEKAKLVKDGKIKKQKSLPPIKGDEEFLQLPENWAWARGESVADFVDPHPSHRTPPKLDGGVPYVGYTDIDHISGIDFENARKISPEVYEEHQARYQLKVGDFVFGKIGTLGQPFFLTEPFDYCLSANLILIQPHLLVIDPRYLAIFLDSPAFLSVMSDKQTNSTHGVFGIKKARLICVPLPPLNEQHLIVVKVDELIALCDTLKTRLNTAQITQLQLADAIAAQLEPPLNVSL